MVLMTEFAAIAAGIMFMFGSVMYISLLSSIV